MIQENGNSIIFPVGLCFHKSFIKTYNGLSIINTRRKLKVWYTKSQQNQIIHYLKDKNIIR
jgi:hypothetical protein